MKTFRTDADGARGWAIELTRSELSSLRGYLRRAQRKGVTIGEDNPTTTAVLAAIGALETTVEEENQ